ncbi:MAG: hypothetical protein J2P55_09590 [Rhizobiales bacterium]|nr:hypothetical protein [Hyphomicrobiales bacterium]
MTDKSDKEDKAPEAKAPPKGGHKNTPQGPATGRPLPDWRMDRDYEQFMPTANM